MGKRDIRPANVPCATPGRTSRHASDCRRRGMKYRECARGPTWRKDCHKDGIPFLGERDHRRVGDEGLGERRERARVVRVHLGFIAARLRLRFSIAKRARLVEAHVRWPSRGRCDQSHWQPRQLFVA